MPTVTVAEDVLNINKPYYPAKKPYDCLTVYYRGAKYLISAPVGKFVKGQKIAVKRTDNTGYKYPLRLELDGDGSVPKLDWRIMIPVYLVGGVLGWWASGQMSEGLPDWARVVVIIAIIVAVRATSLLLFRRFYKKSQSAG